MAVGEPHYSLTDEALSERTIPEIRLSLMTSFYVNPADTQIISREFFSFEPDAMEKQAFYVAELLCWKPSFDPLMKCKDQRDVTSGDFGIGFALQSLPYNSFGCSRTQVIEALDDLSDEMMEIVKGWERVVNL
jgi:hypothetical protein